MSYNVDESHDQPAIIDVNQLSKIYHLYDNPNDRLKQFVIPRLQKILGKQPNSYFNQFWALKDINFKVYQGETIGIIGRNGSGKSTLLQVIAGILAPSTGNVQVDGRIAALLELGAGFNPEFTGRENIYLTSAILGIPREETEENIHEIIRFADIGRFIDQPVKTYSSGMYVRVAFSAAISVNPQILIVDEALAVGDTAFQQKCYFRIRELQEQGTSILLVTHSNNIILEYCNRGIFLKDGQIAFIGKSEEAVRAYGLDILAEEGGKARQRKVGAAGEKLDDGERLSISSSESEDRDLAMVVTEVNCRQPDNTHPVEFKYREDFFVDIVIDVRQVIPLPCFGIEISSTEGISLWSAITKMMNIDMPQLNPGQYKFSWKLKANFSGNRYIIAIGVGQIEGGEYKRIHRLPYATHFDVRPQLHDGIGWISPEPKFFIPEKISLDIQFEE